MNIRGNKVIYLATSFVILVGSSLWARGLSLAPLPPALAQSKPDLPHTLYLPLMKIHLDIQQSAESEQDLAFEDQPACPLEINADASSVSQERLEDLARQGVIQWRIGAVPFCAGTMTNAVDYAQLLLVKLRQGVDPNSVLIPSDGGSDTVLYTFRNVRTCPEELFYEKYLSAEQLASLGFMVTGEIDFLYRTGDMRPICIVTGALPIKFQDALSKALEPADP